MRMVVNPNYFDFIVFAKEECGRLNHMSGPEGKVKEKKIGRF